MQDWLNPSYNCQFKELVKEWKKQMHLVGEEGNVLFRYLRYDIGTQEDYSTLNLLP